MDKAERERLREQTESVVIAAYPSAASWSNDTPYGVTRQPVSEDRRVAVDRLLVLALLRDLDAAEARERALREVLAWYGDERNWDGDGRAGKYVVEYTDDYDHFTDFDCDNGERARAALATTTTGEQ